MSDRISKKRGSQGRRASDRPRKVGRRSDATSAVDPLAVVWTKFLLRTRPAIPWQDIPAELQLTTGEASQHWAQEDEDAISEVWASLGQDIFVENIKYPNHTPLQVLAKLCTRVLRISPNLLVSPYYGLAYQTLCGPGENFSKAFCESLASLILHRCFGASYHKVTCALRYAVICRLDDRRDWSRFDWASDDDALKLLHQRQKAAELPEPLHVIHTAARQSVQGRGGQVTDWSDFLHHLGEIVDNKDSRRPREGQRTSLDAPVLPLTKWDLDTIIEAIDTMEFAHEQSRYTVADGRASYQARRDRFDSPSGSEFAEYHELTFKDMLRTVRLSQRRGDPAQGIRTKEADSQEHESEEHESEEHESEEHESEEHDSEEHESEEHDSEDPEPEDPEPNEPEQLEEVLDTDLEDEEFVGLSDHDSEMCTSSSEHSDPHSPIVEIIEPIVDPIDGFQSLRDDHYTGEQGQELVDGSPLEESIYDQIAPEPLGRNPGASHPPEALRMPAYGSSAQQSSENIQDVVDNLLRDLRQPMHTLGASTDSLNTLQPNIRAMVAEVQQAVLEARADIQHAINDMRGQLRAELQQAINDIRTQMLAENQQALNETRTNMRAESQQALNDTRANIRAENQQAIGNFRTQLRGENQQAINETLANMRAENQQAINETLANMRAENQQAINETLANMRAENQRAINETLANMRAENQQALDATRANMRAENQQAVNDIRTQLRAENQQFLEKVRAEHQNLHAQQANSRLETNANNVADRLPVNPAPPKAVTQPQVNSETAEKQPPQVTQPQVEAGTGGVVQPSAVDTRRPVKPSGGGEQRVDNEPDVTDTALSDIFQGNDAKADEPFTDGESLSGSDNRSNPSNDRSRTPGSDLNLDMAAEVHLPTDLSDENGLEDVRLRSPSPEPITVPFSKDFPVVEPPKVAVKVNIDQPLQPKPVSELVAIQVSPRFGSLATRGGDDVYRTWPVCRTSQPRFMEQLYK
ncbi:hypothetical protein FGRMN_3256 [Fusarium graminum]|nr:hypothetical protein FGRMN_3256 [Fusarium graminum]